MKEICKQLVAITVSLLLAFSASACTRNDELKNNVSSVSPKETVENDIQQESVDNIDIEIISKTVCTESDNDVIKLSIPQISSDNEEEFAQTNLLIYNQVVSYFSELSLSDLYLSDENTEPDLNNDEYERLSLIGDYTVGVNDDEIISIVFSGLWNIKTEPHPNSYSFSINIDKETNQLIDIQSMYDFNKEFTELLLSDNEKWLLRPEQKDVINVLFDFERLNETLTDGSSSFYLTDNKLGVIIGGLPHAAGDYCTLVIPFDDIIQFKT